MAPEQPTNVRPAPLIFLLAGLSVVVVAIAIRFDVFEGLRGGYGWRWLYAPRPLLDMLPLIVGFGIYLVGGYVLLRREAGSRVVLGWSVLGGVYLGFIVVYVQAGNVLFELFARAAAPTGTGPQWMAGNIYWAGGEWRDWAGIMARFGGHLSNLPPGSVMAYASLGWLLDQLPWFSAPIRHWLQPYQCDNSVLLAYSSGEWASTTLGILMPVWAGLLPLPMLHLARRVTFAPHVLLLLCPLIPALLTFGGSWNTVYPLVAALASLYLIKGLEQPSTLNRWVVASGVVSGAGIFFNFALIPLPLFLGVLTLVSVLLRQRRSLLDAIRMGLVFGAGALLPWVVFMAFGGQSFFTILAGSLQFHLDIERPYLPWVVLHTWDWILWNGGGLFVVVVSGFALWGWRKRRAELPIWTLTLVVGMIILVASGTARGETGRVWSFLAPFLLLAFGEMCRAADAREHAQQWIMVAFPQALLIVSLVSVIPTMGTDWRIPQPLPTRPATQSVDYRFEGVVAEAGVFRLVGWDAIVEADAIVLNLNWRGVVPSERLNWISAVSVSAQGATSTIEPRQPGGERLYPTTCWQRDQIVSDTMRIPLADSAETEWWVSISVYSPDVQGSTPLSVYAPNGEVDTQAGLGPIRR
jgi:hypothetical protein